MNAEALLTRIARELVKCKLEAIIIGNAAAALRGAPVTTVDFDFMFRQTPANLLKLKKFARAFEATILRPYYPASGLYRVVNDDTGLQVDFLSRIDGVRSFASLRSRADKMQIGGWTMLVADLADVIASKRAANRPRDRAVLEVLTRTLHETQETKDKSKTGSQARK